MFRCAAPGYVSALYEGAALRDVAEWDVDVELVTRSPAQYWEMISEHVSLAVAALQQVDEPARERIRANAIAKVSAFEKDGKVRVPGVARCIEEAGFGFMFAPAHHQATRFVVPVRRELAVRTIFNLLGPLTNPAGARRQLIGVSEPRFLDTIAGALASLGLQPRRDEQP